jgi:hypothetical protein
VEKLMFAYGPSALVKNVIGRLLPLGLLLGLSVTAAAQTVTTINVPDSTATIALDINDAGTIVGRYVGAIDGRTHGFLRTSGANRLMCKALCSPSLRESTMTAPSWDSTD